MTRLRRRGGRTDRTQTERGAALVEAMVITPVVLMLIFAMIDYGLYFRDDLTASNAARAAARTGVSADADGFVDYDILRNLDDRLTGLGVEPDRIVVFKATSYSDEPPAGCLVDSVYPVCNSYPGSALGWSKAEWIASPERTGWPESERSISNSAGTDLLGIHIRATHTFAIGAFQDTATISETVVYRIEPKAD